MMNGMNKDSSNIIAHIPPNSVGIELGVWKGNSSAKFLTKDLKQLYLVDAWSVEPYRQTTEWTWEEYIQRYQKITGGFTEHDFAKYYQQIYSAVVDRFSIYPNVKIFRMSTDDFFTNHCLTQSWKDTGGRFNHDSDVIHDVDWIYVDASHSYEGVLKDLENSWQIIKPGGKMIGDDYGDNKPGVQQAVDAFVKKYNVTLHAFGAQQYIIEK